MPRFSISVRFVITLLALLFVDPLSTRAQECHIVETARLFAPERDREPFDFDFRAGIAVDESRILVSAWGHAPIREVVFAYDWNGTTWAFVQTIQLTGGQAGFGQAIALDGDLAVITAWFGAGSAYVYRHDNGSWVQEQQLLPSDGASGDAFGSSAAILGDRIIIGATREDSGPPNDSGAAYIFRFNGTQWVEEQKIKAAVPMGSAYFGTSVDADDGTILIGGGQFSFYAYVFTHNGTQWVQQQRLESPDPTGADGVGSDVAIDGDRLVIGAPMHNLNAVNDAGAAYVFRRIAGTWTFWQKLTPQLPATPADEFDRFGQWVALKGDVIVVANPNDDIILLGNPPMMSDHKGTMRHFHLQGDTWISDGLWRGGIGGAGQNVAMNSTHIFTTPALLSLYTGFHEMLTVFDAVADDCDQNGVPDICDVDCNLNMVADACDISSGDSGDCNQNGLPDECEAPQAYVQDTGVSAGGSYMFGGSPADRLFLNGFTVTAGHETLTHMAVAWDSIQLGAQVELMVYDDPNNDGNPNDAMLLSRTPVIAPNAITQLPNQPARFSIHRIAPIFVGNEGESFFLGVFATSTYRTFAAVRDVSQGDLPSWRVDGSPGAGNVRDLSQGWLEISQQIFGINLIRGLALDCNGNGVWDGCDISSGSSLDANNNGIPDECDGPASPCAADLAPDGTVNVQDLLAVIGAWGACANPSYCPADIAPAPSGDDTVNVQDLLAVIAAWGACP